MGNNKICEVANQIKECNDNMLNIKEALDLVSNHSFHIANFEVEKNTILSDIIVRELKGMIQVEKENIIMLSNRLKYELE